MSYKIFIIALLLLTQTLAYTEITSQNCPAQFDVASANVTKSKMAENLGSFLYSGFQSSTSKSRVTKIVITGDTNDL